MLNLFKSRSKSDNKMSSEVINSALITIWVNSYGKYFLDNNSKDLSYKIRCAETKILEKLEELEYMGLKESLNYKNLESLLSINNSKSRNIGEKAYNFIKKIREISPDLIVIPFEDYINFLRKYNLVTGKLSEFSGLIPEDKISELKDLSHKFLYGMDKFYPSGSIPISHPINELYPIECIEIVDNYKSMVFRKEINKVINELRLFPFNDSTDNIRTRIKLILGDSKNSDKFLEEILKVYVKSTSKLIYSDWLISCNSGLVPDIPITYKKVVKTPEPVIVDPIIIKYCEYGFIIGPRWRVEGEDKVFEEMKEFLDKSISL